MDAFWRRESGTVAKNYREFKEQVTIGKRLGIGKFDPMVPFPLYYNSGMWVAIGVLAKAESPGRHED